MHFLKVLYMDKVDDCCIYKLCKILAVYNSREVESAHQQILFGGRQYPHSVSSKVARSQS